MKEVNRDDILENQENTLNVIGLMHLRFDAKLYIFTRELVMGIKESMNSMRNVLAEINVDLEKAANGNKAAAQRVRVNTISLEKIAKIYRKESVSVEKKASAKANSTSSKKTVAKKTATKSLKKKK